MIVDFTITNFRSIKDEQIFSLYVDKSGNDLTDNIAYPADKEIGVLKTAGIYGANASGKSNLFLALGALRYMAIYSDELKDGDRIPCYEPFLLSAKTKHAPVKFEIEFYNHNLQRFIYTIAFTAHHIVQESLYFFTSRSKSMLFNRQEMDTWKDIAFGPAYKGGKKQFGLFSNNSYFSKAGNAADAPKIIQDAYQYLRKGLHFINARSIKNAKKLIKDTHILGQIAGMIKHLDTGIETIDFEDDDEIEIDDFINALPEQHKKKYLEDQKTKVVYSHKTEEGGIIKFHHDTESDGTRAMFNLFPTIIMTFAIGGVLFFDEIEKNLHPHIAELMIKLFNDQQVNKLNAQLLFTSHNTQLMSSDYLRRDQVWFIEKENGASTLTCLDSFDKDTVRANSPYGEWYSQGRFGAIPTINYLEIVKELNKGIHKNA